MIDGLDTQSPSVNVSRSGLVDVPGKYSIKEPRYYKGSNILNYKVEYAPISISNDKFVLDEVEFYVTKTNGNIVNSVYFNEFQNKVYSSNGTIPIDHDMFSIEGRKYVIDNFLLKVHATDVKKLTETGGTETNSQLFKDAEYSQDIIDNRFKVDGIWYKISEDGSKLTYSSAEDQNLVQVTIGTDGTGNYEPWNLQFKFSSDWKKVSIVRDCFYVVED